MKIRITQGFWKDTRELIRSRSLPHQWRMMEERGTIDNFRIAAGRKKGPRRGFFHTDSDLHKWAEGAAWFLAENRDDDLPPLMEEYVDTVTAAQQDDGYLYTLNQIAFPGTRWVNLRVEHELYCMGHFIEAALAHREASGDGRLFLAARKTADLIVYTFMERKDVPGHPEIELALARLYRVTGQERYLEMSRRFVLNRGNRLLPGLRLAGDFLSHAGRMKEAAKRGVQESSRGFDLGETSGGGVPFSVRLRAPRMFLDGSYLVESKPLAEVEGPVGHAVRWNYLLAAATAVAGEANGKRDLDRYEQLWEHMVERKTYVTGGIGSLPVTESFGRDYELPAKSAYCETCAAVGAVLWDMELARYRPSARYHDHGEWLLHNATGVSTGADGETFFYRNPLESDGTLERKEWFDTACCPGNLSRLYGRLGEMILAEEEEDLAINQYISSTARLENGSRCVVRSTLPWSGRVVVELNFSGREARRIRFRVPSWTDEYSLTLNGRGLETEVVDEIRGAAGGYAPHGARYAEVERYWEGNNSFELHFSMPVRLRQTSATVAGFQGMSALSRGPVLYCAEEADNPSGIPELDPYGVPDVEEGDIAGRACRRIHWLNGDGTSLRLIPWYLWGNRERGWMRIWLKEK